MKISNVINTHELTIVLLVFEDMKKKTILYVAFLFFIQ